MVAGSDAHPAFGFARGRLRGPAARTYPVSAAGEAVVRGIERRAPTVVVPGWARALLALRGVLAPLGARQFRKNAEEMDARFQADVAARGREEASAPVGAGGEAARRAS
jgi:hypothetical protein